jgi:hypothetical protein
MWYLIQNPEDTAGRRASRTVGQPPAEIADIERYVRALSEDIGPRHSGLPESIRITVNYLESTLGPRNIGCTVVRQGFGGGTDAAGDAVWENVVAEVPGTLREAEVVVVGAHYDTLEGSPGANCDATGVAAVLALARAFAGTAPQRTLRFLLFGNGAGQSLGVSGAAAYAAECKQRGDRIMGVVLVGGIGSPLAEGAPVWPPELAPFLPQSADVLVLAGERNAADCLNVAADGFDSASEIASQRLVVDGIATILGSKDLEPWGAAGFPAFLATDLAAFRPGYCGSAQDVASEVDFARVTDVIRGLEIAVRRLINP